jgi:hypothetical protein
MTTLARTRDFDRLRIALAIAGLLAAAACGGTAKPDAGEMTTGESTESISSGNSTTGGTASTTGASSSGSSTTSGSSTSRSGTTTGGTNTGGFTIAPHNPLPQVPDNGTPVLSQPAIVTIGFADYPYDITAYATKLVQSSWLAAVGADYGVGLGAVVGSAVIDGGPSTITDPEIAELLNGLILDGGVPAPTADTVYVVTFPMSTSIVVDGTTSCHGIGGYHAYFTREDGTAYWVRSVT